MNVLNKTMAGLLVFVILCTSKAFADNQTTDLSPILPESELPFRIVIEEAHFQLPVGIHSGVVGTYKGLWVFIAGSRIGMHGFSAFPFPSGGQNTDIFVVNPSTGVVLSRSLNDSGSGLNQQQIESLSVISPQGYQENDTLYMSGGYGVDTLSPVPTFNTKPVLTAIYLPGIVQWVSEPNNPNLSVIANIRQLYNPLFQITGGEMYKLGNYTRLVFGQNYTHVYDSNTSGDYSKQMRQFKIIDNAGQLAVDIAPSIPLVPDPNFRRRDLNIVPVLLNNNNQLEYGLVAYAGVFTESDGVWTVPVVIKDNGDPQMANPNLAETFKQGMNHYSSATAGLYSRKYQSMYTLLFGGISYGFYNSQGDFATDNEVPFINQVTTIRMDKNQHFTQYFMNSEYPEILSEPPHSNPGNQLLFGAGAYFLNANIPRYPNSVISLDAIRKETVIGYIVGGIASTVPNTSVITDSFGSPYVFKVTLVPTH